MGTIGFAAAVGFVMCVVGIAIGMSIGQATTFAAIDKQTIKEYRKECRWRGGEPFAVCFDCHARYQQVEMEQYSIVTLRPDDQQIAACIEQLAEQLYCTYHSHAFAAGDQYTWQDIPWARTKWAWRQTAVKMLVSYESNINLQLYAQETTDGK